MRITTAASALAFSASSAWLALPVLAQTGGEQAASGAEQFGRGEIISNLLHWITLAIEIAGIGVIVVGAVLSTLAYGIRLLRGADDDAYHAYRSSLGKAILLGLEFLVAADIIGTVAIEPTLDSLAVLAGIVLIRTFLSFALEVEIEGRWPWQAQRQGDQQSKVST